MNCPVCELPLLMTEREGVEIDYCPKCRGVWLDRGELDKIIERGYIELEHEERAAILTGAAHVRLDENDEGEPKSKRTTLRDLFEF